MSFSSLIFYLIDFRSFSNLWYWISLCVLWSSASHWVVGVPYDMVWRARREGGQAQADLETMVRINTGRMLWHSREYGAWGVGVLAFLLTSLLVLAVFYASEFALSLLLILVPVTGLFYITLRACLKIEAGEGQGDLLLRRLFVTRISVQGLGMGALFVAAIVGMYANMLQFIPR